ncbi:diacylglycerol/polyprenol kinase family protein [Rivularia sp. PCC 7116]|uniref:diacylglycerol/polyprenol kinase family protein n=1 Tax=Rivularia sp. PCC 7116 TaxID=373994 RepID=UPI0035277562
MFKLNSFTASYSISPLWLQVIAVAIWVSLILLSAAAARRFAKSDSEIVRKIVHIGTGNVILLAWWLDIPASIGISASILASLVTLLSYKFPILPGINSVGRKSLGTFFYSASIGVLIGWFWYLKQPFYAVIGILIMAWGDGLAALVGQRFGKHKYSVLGGQKSLEGSLTMTVVSFIICILVLQSVQGNTGQNLLISLTIAVVATALEAISFLGLDNITVPLGSAALAFVLNQLINN